VRDGLTEGPKPQIDPASILVAEVEPEPLPEEFSGARLRRSLLLMGGLVVALVVALALLPGLGSLREGFSGANPGWLVAVVVLQVLSCASYVLVFKAVFCRRISWRTSSEIGLSELAANSFFSAGGAGGLALGAWILRRGGVSAGHVARRTVAFFLLTSLPNILLLTLGGLALATGLAGGPSHVALGVIPAVVGVAAIALTIGARQFAHWVARRTPRERLARWSRALAEGVGEALRLLRPPDWKLGVGAFGYLLFDIASLGACFVAFGMDLPPVAVLVEAYLIGQLGGLIPIPGGIGGSDGGLIGALVLYGVDARDAAVAVIAYRGVLLVVPALLGLPALAIIRRRLRAERHDIASCAPGEAVEVLGGTFVRGRVAT
jgi:uncharacterized protein (TIRG00374 family)